MRVHDILSNYVRPSLHSRKPVDVGNHRKAFKRISTGVIKKFYIPLVVLTLCLRAVSGSTATFEHHYISENPTWDFRVMRSVLVDIDKDGKPPLSRAGKHPDYQVTL